MYKKIILVAGTVGIIASTVGTGVVFAAGKATPPTGKQRTLSPITKVIHNSSVKPSDTKQLKKQIKKYKKKPVNTTSTKTQ